MSSCMDTWNSNMRHERDDCNIVWLRLWFEVVAFRLNKDFTGFISLECFFNCPTLLEHFTSCVPFYFPQDSMVDLFAWWEMTGMSLHRYFLIRFSRAMCSGGQLTQLLLFHLLRVFMESTVTKTNLVCWHTAWPLICLITLGFKKCHKVSE